MKLNAEIYEALKEALSDALGLAETQQLARPALDVDWEKVFAEKDLIEDRIEKLIRQAEQLDRVHLLAGKALEMVPTNQGLQTFILQHVSELCPPPSRYVVRVPVPALSRRAWIGFAPGLIAAFVAGGLVGYALRRSPPPPEETRNPWDAQLARARFYTPLATPPSAPANWPEVDSIADRMSNLAISGVNRAEIANLVVEFGPFPAPANRVRVSTLVGARSDILAQVFKRQGDQQPALVRQPTMLQRGRNPLRLILPRCEAGERVYVVLSIRPSEPASPGVVPPDLDRSALPALISFRRLPDDDET